MENNEIVLKQLPIIVHKLQDAGKSVQKRIDSLELDKQVATEETVKSMKVLRAELNKEVKDFEEQRGYIKSEVNKPYLEFESIYKTEITDRYKKATDLLKNNIDTVEFKIKKEKENNIKEYFDELCVAECIDFVKFESLKIEVNLSTAEKKYKEQVYAFIEKVNDDLALIKATDFEAEIMTEYKLTLNASKAITTVKTRKESEAAEEAKIKAELIQNRKNALIKLGLNYVEITNAYEYNDDIFVSLSDVINRSKEEFIKIHAEVSAKIKSFVESQIVEDTSHNLTKEEFEEIDKHFQPETIEVKGDLFEVSKTEGINPETGHSRIVKPVIAAPISAPKVEFVQEEIKTASFEVKATMSKLRLLGAWMKENGIEYKNI